MHASNGILFNHESERRGHEFVTRKVTDGVARIALGLADNIALGNLDSLRDWGYAPDYVEGMWRILQQDEPDDYVLATGVAHSIRDLLTIAFDEVGINDWEERGLVVQDPRFYRPAEVDVLCGDASKARDVLNWSPNVDFEGMIRRMVQNDLNILGN
jgi:GDPmannose 4,6-dehydratase